MDKLKLRVHDSATYKSTGDIPAGTDTSTINTGLRMCRVQIRTWISFHVILVVGFSAETFPSVCPFCPASLDEGEERNN